MREKIIKYLTEGIDIHIPEDEVQTFYDLVTKYINEADNEFEAFFFPSEEYVLISDKYTDYLKCTYENNKIIFLHANSDNEFYRDPEFTLKAGLAFIGVLLFIESFAPSSDSAYISQKHYDQWRI